MIRVAKIAFLFFIIMAFGTAAVFAGSDPIKIKLDGVDVVSDSPPVIIDGRTLVPARFVFEAMGGNGSLERSDRRGYHRRSQN